MKFRLKTKLTLALVSVSLILILLMSLLVNFLLEKQFRQYIIEKQENRNKQIVKLINQQFSGQDSWNWNAIQDIGMNALDEGLIIKVTDSEGKTIWDAVKHNGGLCQQMINHMTQNMMSRYPNWDGKYTVKDYPLIFNGSNVGTVEIGYYGPFFFNDNELQFINTLNTVMIWIAVFAIVFSLLLGSALSKKLSTPIAKVINAAQMIAKGNYSVRSEEKTDTLEIEQLTEAVNNLAKALENQEKLRKRLTGDVAHELRTPMATLQSHVEAMIDGIWEPSTERLKSCHEEITRINKMVSELGKLAKFEGEALVLNKSSFNIKDLISNIIINFESQFKNKDVEISLRGEDETIYADKDTLAQVFINLISNALKYTPSGGKVEINLKRTDKFLEISVKDNGQGISEEDLPHIFERFYRADKSRNRMTGGSGIGLTIAKSIVEAHGGTIKVSSEIGVGTEFIVGLPLLDN